MDVRKLWTPTETISFIFTLVYNFRPHLGLGDMNFNLEASKGPERVTSLKVRLLYLDISKEARVPVVELRTFQNTAARYTRSLGLTGAPDYQEIVIIHPLSSATRIAKSISNRTALLVNAAKEKRRCDEGVSQ